MKDPIVSVIVPTYNCWQHIETTICSAIHQSIDNIEIIVVDDASTDKTYNILEKLSKQDNRIALYQNHHNMGAAITRNNALARTKGQYIAFLDSDDLWHPNKLEKQLEQINKKNCDWCYTAYSFINEEGESIGRPYQVPETVTLKDLLTENVIGCSTVLCRAQVIKKYFMRAEYAHEDYVLWLELLRAGYQVCGICEPLMMYRIHEGNRSRNKKNAAKNRWIIYRRFLGLSVIEAGWYFSRYCVAGMKKQLFLR